MTKKSKKKKHPSPYAVGFIGSAALLAVYFGIVSAAESVSHAFQQFAELWYWLLILVVGFGIQVGLYSHIRTSFRLKQASAGTPAVATAGGISTTSMIACCAHHLTDVLPIIGLSAAAVFLVQYQVPFIVVGILSNLVGITIMLDIIQRHRLFSRKNLFKEMFRYNMRRARNLTAVLSVGLFSIVLVATVFSTPVGEAADEVVSEIQAAQTFDLPAKINDENGVSFEAKPKDFSYDKEVLFEIKIDTHEGALDFGLTEISILEDDQGKKYRPLNWAGSPPGGHHRAGTLTFPQLESRSKSMKLTIKDVYGVPERAFVWDLSIN